LKPAPKRPKRPLVDNFWAYIDGLGVLSDEELFEDIDETMERREGEGK